MDAADDGARRRLWVLGLIILVHLLFGLLFFSSPGPAPGPRRSYAGVGGFAGVTGVAASTPAAPARKVEGFVLSFDRTPLVGPSTFAPPSRAGDKTRKVAPSSHPS